jgi:Bacterial Ig-like domain (group 3)
MHFRVNKLVYLPLGGALGAGLLVSAFVAPQPKLAASQDCYGVCHAATTLSLSRSTVTVGAESVTEFRVTVSGNNEGSGPPAGHVQIDAGTRWLCGINLSGGSGHCSTGNKDLPAGSYEVRALYLGNANFNPSESAAEHLEVLRDSTTTGLSLSRTSVTYGREGEEEFHATVRGDNPGLGDALGSVSVDAGDRVLCRINLSGGEGHCYLPERALEPGSYEIQAHYGGDSNLIPSSSSSKHLEVYRS